MGLAFNSFSLHRVSFGRRRLFIFSIYNADTNSEPDTGSNTNSYADTDTNTNTNSESSIP